MAETVSLSIVEDQDDIRAGLTAIFESSPEFTVLSTYADAESAAEELIILKPDIVIMDINLPGMNGIECIRRIKPSCPEVQFMMFTIFENHENVLEALQAGATGYLLKSTPPSRIREAVLELHQGGSPMNSHIARKLVSVFQKTGNNSPADTHNLTPREKEILEYLSKGFLYKEIASACNISTGTVKQHIHKIYEKLHVQNRTEALNKFYGL